MKIRVISASRRTDIPAFYGTWLTNRVRAGWCAVPNPFNSKQISRVELNPRETIFVFWTRWAKPFIKHLDELEQLGCRFYFQYTLINNPKAIDPNSPSLEKAIDGFRCLADRIGAERLIWRYDPILLSQTTDHDFHLQNFSYIAERLSGATKRVVVSIVDPYDKAARRMDQLGKTQPSFRYRPYQTELDLPLFRNLAGIARNNELTIQSCAEEIELLAAGIQPGKCIDDDLIRTLFEIDVTHAKDKGQRSACGCVESRDIGMYESCLFGCAYCYATQSFAAAEKNHASHNPESESLLGNHCAPPAKAASRSSSISIPFQPDLFA
ncbi:DUF1848 domain-containing protein [uncultured Lamprocystis sp.]|jgi:DNA repair photolyase|uniref:DUF1848 domain-containing protein n=3 Tax=uncultured Lamprocystis sp. TaxID=543132 RepID=UPI0025F29F9F|nr:DUF1848 domain-containing protein [uncultured Lamprocystis sp.]